MIDMNTFDSISKDINAIAELLGEAQLLRHVLFLLQLHTFAQVLQRLFPEPINQNEQGANCDHPRKNERILQHNLHILKHVLPAGKPEGAVRLAISKISR